MNYSGAKTKVIKTTELGSTVLLAVKAPSGAFVTLSKGGILGFGPEKDAERYTDFKKAAEVALHVKVMHGIKCDVVPTGWARF